MNHSYNHNLSNSKYVKFTPKYEDFCNYIDGKFPNSEQFNQILKDFFQTQYFDKELTIDFTMRDLMSLHEVVINVATDQNSYFQQFKKIADNFGLDIELKNKLFSYINSLQIKISVEKF